MHLAENLREGCQITQIVISINLLPNHNTMQCFKNVVSYIGKEKNLVLGKKISAQPTASKKIETPLRIGVVFKGMGFGGRNRDSKVEKAISR